MLLCIDDMLKRSTGRGEGGVVKLIVQYLYESNYRYTVTKVMTKEGWLTDCQSTPGNRAD